MVLLLEVLILEMNFSFYFICGSIAQFVFPASAIYGWSSLFLPCIM